MLHDGSVLEVYCAECLEEIFPEAGRAKKVVLFEGYERPLKKANTAFVDDLADDFNAVLAGFIWTTLRGVRSL